MDTLLEQFLAIVREVDRRNLYIPPVSAVELRRLGFSPHYTYLRPPRPPPPPPRPRCPAMTHAGTQCTNKCSAGLTTCMIHSDNPTPRPVPLDYYRCPETTPNGQCKCAKYKQYPMCWRHSKRAGLLPPPPEVPTDCSICYVSLSEGQKVKTVCGHYFHATCFDLWKTSRQTNFQVVTCPMCRHTNPNPKNIA